MERVKVQDRDLGQYPKDVANLGGPFFHTRQLSFFFLQLTMSLHQSVTHSVPRLSASKRALRRDVVNPGCPLELWRRGAALTASATRIVSHLLSDQALVV